MAGGNRWIQPFLCDPEGREMRTEDDAGTRFSNLY